MNRPTQGFTLIEALVALSILGIIIMTVLSAALSNTALNSKNEQISQGAIAAQRVMDGIRATDPASLPPTGTTPVSVVTVGGRAYNVTLTYCDPADYCSDSARRIRVDVKSGEKIVFTVEDVLTSVGSGIVSANVAP